MRYLSLFSGIEAASVAWSDLGWEPVAFSEIEPFPCAVLAERFPDVPNLGDITKIDWSEFNERYGAIDIVVGGSPCQSFSVAGGRAGLDGESGLMFEYLRCVRDTGPRWVLWENVCGVFSIDSGKAFGTFISSLQDFGYCLAWRVLDAQFFGVAQRRRRVFVVGYLGERACPAAVLFERTSVSGNTKTSKQQRETLARQAEGGSGKAVYSRTERPHNAGDASVFKETGLANTLNTYDIGDKRSNELVVEPAGFKFHQGSDAHGLGYEEGVSPTLTADWHQPAVTEPVCMAPAFSKRPGQQIATTDGGVSYALTTGEPPRITYIMASGQYNTEIGNGISPTLAARAYKDPPIAIDERVRRLTPVECERLQGFPDGWTDIPYKGKEHPPDGVRYKALGNSFAVPVVKWIGERIAQVERIMEEEQ